MKDEFLHAIAKAEIQAIEAADLCAANDEIFDDYDLPDYLDMQEVAEHY